MIVGVTGTRNGMTNVQFRIATQWLQLLSVWELHHGDCLGVDLQMAEIARTQSIRTVSHPPVEPRLRAYHKSDEFRPPKTYAVRNREIVDASDHLIALVKNAATDVYRSGTWQTIRYCTKQYPDKPLVVIGSDGSLDVPPLEYTLR